MLLHSLDMIGWIPLNGTWTEMADDIMDREMAMMKSVVGMEWHGHCQWIGIEIEIQKITAIN